MQALPGRWCKPLICSSGSWPNACGSGSLGHHKTVTQDKIIMLDWFIGLSDTNKIAFVGAIVVPIAIAVSVKFGRRKKDKTPLPTENSPVFYDPTGDVTINYNAGLTPEVFDQLKALFNEKAGLNEQDTNSTHILTSVIKNYLDENTAHKQSIAELTETVSVQAERIKNVICSCYLFMLRSLAWW